MNISLVGFDHSSISGNRELNKFVKQVVNNSRTGQNLHYFIPLTLPFKDNNGKELQLWKIKGYGLFGTILSENDIFLVPKFRIRSAISDLSGRVF